MERVTISKLKNQFSAYLRKVRAGHDIVVLDRDVPIARLVPIETNQIGDERLAQLEEQGLVKRAAKAMPLDLLRSPPPRAEDSVLEALIEERREGR